ncbi:MAG TPA: SusC/RagA family TonB-linked outer membrane protein [Gemmatimonadaceae bacterium]|nr:SusC/RagA family TonB-linked outer membrane protein [Gemmatimonadaceae bacterium]
MTGQFSSFAAAATLARRIGRRLAVLGALAVVPAWAAAQEPARISGRVTSEDGQPVPAATVFIQSLNVGTQTGDNGQYTLTVPGSRAQGSAEIVVRRIGYRPTTQTVTLAPGATLTINFTLPAASIQLSEVVVTGAGTVTTAAKLGSARNNVDSAAITRSAETNVVNALAAKAPNVEIVSQSGDPGASSFIRIRGAVTIQGTGQPLFVVDGMPVDNTTYSTGNLIAGAAASNRASDINPADIENIEILKGAAAAAIYGARAAQGVVLITTKSGKAGQTRYSLRSTYTVDKVSNGVPLQRTFGQGAFDGSEYYGMPALVCTETSCNRSAIVRESWGPRLTETDYKAALMGTGLTAAEADAAFAAAFPNGIRTFDHFGELFDTGHTWDNNLQISGGNEKTTFFLSAGRSDQDGIIIGPNNWYDRTSLRLKATHSLNDRFRVGGNVAYVDARGSFVQKGSNLSGLMLGGVRSPAEFDNSQYLDPVTGWHRSFRNPRPTALAQSRLYDNPFFTANEVPSTSDVGRVYGNFDADYRPLDWLSLKLTAGADYASDARLEAYPLSASEASGLGAVTVGNITNYELDENFTATAERTFGENFAGTFTLGQNLNSRRLRRQFVTGEKLKAPEPYQLSNTIDLSPNDYEQLIHTESYFGQATFDLYNQLFLTLGVRNDGFSTFGSSQRRHWFPKASAAWTFSTITGDLGGKLDFAKLRVAYGETGREPLPYQTITAFSTSFVFDGGWGGGLNSSQGGLGGLISSATKGQNDLKPERTKEIEAGLDFGILQDRADASVTYYNRKSVDVILLTPLATSTGYQQQVQNAATIRNRGVEVSLNVRPVQAENLGVELGFNWAKNDNRVLDLQGAEYVGMPGSFTDPLAVAQKGSRVGVLRSFDFARCGITDASMEIDLADGSTSTLGALCGNAPNGALFIAEDGKPILDPVQRVIMDPSPDWTGSLRGAVTLFKKWQVGGLLDIKQGGQVWNGTKGATYHFGTHKDTEIRGEERTFGKDWMQGPVAGPGAGTPVVLDQDWFTGLGGGFGPATAQFIEDGSYVKLRELSLSYTADAPWVRNRLGLSSIDFRVAGRNLKTWTDYTGIDPETNLGGAEVQLRGIDFFNNPQTRSFVFSVGLNR